jgi:hypothetical protein
MCLEDTFLDLYRSSYRQLLPQVTCRGLRHTDLLLLCCDFEKTHCAFVVLRKLVDIQPVALLKNASHCFIGAGFLFESFLDFKEIESFARYKTTNLGSLRVACCYLIMAI